MRKLNKRKTIENLIAGGFIVAVLVALVMSWYSMTDLATVYFGLPMWIAVVISLAFDLGAIVLALITLLAALDGEGAFMAKLGTLAFIGTSIYINVQHAILSNYGMVGMVTFGAAPFIVFILFEVYLKFITKRERKKANQVPDRMPSAGALAWIFKFGDSRGLFMKGLENRVNQARGQLKYVPEVEGTNQGDNGTEDMSPIKAKADVSLGDKGQLDRDNGTTELALGKGTELVPAGQNLSLSLKQPMGFVSPSTVVPQVNAKGQSTGTAGQAQRDNGTAEGHVPSWVVSMDAKDFYRLCKDNGVTAAEGHKYMLTFKPEAKYDTVKKGIQRA